MNKKLLLTQTQMHDVYKKGFKKPYFYSISKDNRYIYFIGSSHSSDPTDSQFMFIKEVWKKFVENIKATPKIAFIEGGNWPSAETEEKTILKYGEPGFTKFLAEKENIMCISPEPSDIEVFKKIENNFSKDEIMLLFFCRTAAQWNRQKDKPNFEEYIGRYLERNKKTSGWKEYDFSINHMITIFEKYTKKKFDKKDEQSFYNIYCPTDENVAGAISVIRENYILDKINEYWNQKYSIFIVYGSGHAIRQEPVLKDLVN